MSQSSVNPTELLGSLQRQHVEQALRQLDAGAVTRFSDSVKYDLIFAGKYYPPKRVAGLALEIMTGISFGPESFTGGLESACFRALQRCGFTISPKAVATARTLAEDLFEILVLQREYSSRNTATMERRGVLVRSIIPDHIRNNLGRLEPIFTAAGYSVSVEGSDGIGRKVESPWVRIFDPILSPSATIGWYVVLHFSRNGEDLFLTAGCGATILHQGSLTPLPAEDLELKVAWAREVAKRRELPITRFQDSIELQGNDLSRQFERATAYAKIYHKRGFSENDFWEDTASLCRLLVELYEEESLGKAPFSEPPEIRLGQDEIDLAVAGRTRGRAGQGRNLSVAERVAIEERAMLLARQALEGEGFSEVKDVHRNESFDFSATRSGSSWVVEVKGTTSKSVDCFLLTAAELRLHRENPGQTILILVYDIDLVRTTSEISASGGRVQIHLPWVVEDWDFEATAYRARRIQHP